MNITVNNIELYYEAAGSGSPLIMIHGNGESHEIFDEAVSVLSKYFTCYLIDSRGHGKSQKVSEFHYADMAEDVYQFIQALSLQNITFYGFSDGGIVGLLLASSYPDLFERMIISGANTSPKAIEGWVDENFPDWRQIMKKSALFKLMMTEPDISREQLEAIKTPTLVLAGSEDVIDENDTRFIAESIPGAKLQILPGENHDSYIVGSTKIAELILEYCEKRKMLFEMDKKDYGPNDERYYRPSVRAVIRDGSRFAMVHSRKYDYYKFPGGGIEAGEDHMTALIREVREETGLNVVPSEIREYGMVRRSQKGKSEGTVFVQDNFYYLCEVLDGNIGQNLDDYEDEEGFTLEYVTAEKVIETNRNADHGAMNEDEFYQLMIERDARVMDLILQTF